MILLALSLWLSVAPVVDAVRITVVDGRTQVAVPDVRVHLHALDPTSSVVFAGDSDRSGVVTFATVPPGRYLLTVSTVGYAFVRRDVTVAADSPVHLTIPLTEGTGTHQEAVTVAGTSAGSTDVGVSSQVVLGSAAIQDLRGIATDDPLRAVQTLPGVVTGDDFQAEFSVRGSAFRHVGLVIDETPSPLLLHAVRGRDDTGSLAMVSADVLDRAALLSGPHPQRHGEWIGATLEFGIREGSRDRTHLRGTISGTSASVVLEGPLGGQRGSWLFTVRKSYVDWLIRKLDPDIKSLIGFTDAQSKLTWDLTSRQQLQLLLTGGEAVYREPNTSVTNGLHKAVSTGGLASLAWRYTGDALVVRQRVSVTTSRFTNTGMRGQALGDGTSTTTMWRGDVSQALSTNVLVEAGARAEHTTLDQTLRRYGLAGGELRQTAFHTVTGARQVLSAWGQMAWRGASSGLMVGIRAVDADHPHARWVAPWLLAEQHLGRVTLRAGVGATRQLPPLVFAVDDDAQVRPERARGADGSVALRIGQGGRLQITGFVRDDEDILRPVGEERLLNGIRVRGTVFPLGDTRLDGTSRGVDVLLQRTAATGSAGLTGWIAYTWAHTTYTDQVSDERFDGDFDQRHTLNVFAHQRLSFRSSINAKLRIGSNVPLVGYFQGDPSDLRLGDTRNQVRLPWYVRLDLRANRTFVIKHRRLTLFAELVNALGRRNLGQADGFVRTAGYEAVFFTEKLIPRIPSVGMLIEF
ncbi:MAG: TonB-dependent receptor [Acidobacteria bacterium]|nr:TonB-dependent receptor [Acidobacteriota bacterium]